MARGVRQSPWRVVDAEPHLTRGEARRQRGAGRRDDPSEHAEWRARIALVAEANWASCQRHPWITEAVPGRPLPGPGAAVKYEIELGALDGLGLSDIEMDHTLTALLALVHGTARASLAARRSREPDEQDDTWWWARVEPVLSAAIGDAARFPAASRVARALGAATGKANDPEGAYRHGVALFLDGLAQQRDSGWS